MQTNRDEPASRAADRMPATARPAIRKIANVFIPSPLENVLQGELHDPRILCRENLSEVLTVEACARIVRIHMIGDVECLDAEFQRLLFANVERSCYCRVDADAPRSRNCRWTKCAVCPDGGNGECRGIQPEIDALIRSVCRREYLIRPLV